MSTVTVGRRFKTMTADLKLTSREQRALRKEALKGGVTPKEAALFAKYASRAVTATDPRALVLLAKGSFFAAPSTKKELEQFATHYAGKPTGPTLPTAEQLEKLYTGIAQQRLSDGAGVPLDGPPVANPNDFPSYDMTPEGLQDVNRTLFVINDRLIHRTSGMGPTGIMSQWQDLGPAPLY